MYHGLSPSARPVSSRWMGQAQQTGGGGGGIGAGFAAQNTKKVRCSSIWRCSAGSLEDMVGFQALVSSNSLAETAKLPGLKGKMPKMLAIEPEVDLFLPMYDK